MQTVIGVFEDRAQAERAVDKLAELGLAREDVHIERQDAGSEPREHHHHKGFFAWLFGDDDQATTYSEAVRRGSSAVVVDARDDAQAEQAAACLHDLGAMNVDERAQQWRSEGWSGDTGILRENTVPQAAANVDVDADADRQDVLKVVQEELQVGKRTLDRGGVRVVQRLSEQPVREVVRLREERATVDRRAVDRPATAADLDTFKEGTIEVREMTEEPVVAKTARVVEEVRVGKEVREREETVEDRVRRKDVDVERMEGGTRTVEERERAVASESDDLPSADRDPDAPVTTGKRKPRKNL